jgi:hypothetical protein
LNKNNGITKAAKETGLEAFAANPILTILASFASIIGLPLSIWSGNNTVRVIAISILGLALLLIIQKVFSYKNLRKKAETAYQEKVNEITSKYAIELDDIIDVVVNYNACYKLCLSKINSGGILADDHLNDALVQLSTCIQDISQKILHEKVSVCIKMIVVESAMNEDISTWRIKTIARSEGTRAKRRKYDSQSVLVSENTDFITIIKGNDAIHSDNFAVPNIPHLIDV